MIRWFVALVLVVTMIPSVAAAQLAAPDDRRDALKHYRAGQQFLLAEHWEKAAGEFTQAIKLDSLLTLAHYGLGQAYMGLKDYAAAIRAYTRCKEAHHRLAQLQDSNRVAVERMQEEELRELKDSLHSIQSGMIKGVNPITLERLNNRIRDLEKGRQRNAPITQATPAEVSLALGSAYFRRGDLADAEREYNAAIEVNPNFGEAHNNLSVVYLMTQRSAEAEEEVKLAERAGYKVNPQLKDDIKAAKPK